MQWMSRNEERGREEQPNWFETRSRNEVVETIKGKRRSTFRRHQTDFFHLQVFFVFFYCMIEQGVKNVSKMTKKSETWLWAHRKMAQEYLASSHEWMGINLFAFQIHSTSCRRQIIENLHENTRNEAKQFCSVPNQFSFSRAGEIKIKISWENDFCSNRFNVAIDSFYLDD